MIYVSDSDLLNDGQIGRQPTKPTDRNQRQLWGSAQEKTSTKNKQSREEQHMTTPTRTLELVCQMVSQIIFEEFAGILEVIFPKSACCASACFSCSFGCIHSTSETKPFDRIPRLLASTALFHWNMFLLICGSQSRKGSCSLPPIISFHFLMPTSHTLTNIHQRFWLMELLKKAEQSCASWKRGGITFHSTFRLREAAFTLMNSIIHYH